MADAVRTRILQMFLSLRSDELIVWRETLKTLMGFLFIFDLLI